MWQVYYLNVCRDLHLALKFMVFTEIYGLRKVKFGEKLFQTKLLSCLSHKVYLSRPNDSLWERWKAWALIMSISVDLLEQATCIICL